MTSEWINNEPQLIEKDYKKRYKTPCSLFKGFQNWYKGTGISPQDHPLNGYINMKGCGNCKSENVKVIAAEWNVAYHSGDVYWDYEIYCEDCGKYTQRAYAEN